MFFSSRFNKRVACLWVIAVFIAFLLPSSYESVAVSESSINSTALGSGPGNNVYHLSPCSTNFIQINQDSMGTMPNGIPLFVVEILNEGGCGSHVYVSCGWFSSVEMVNPKVFRRLSYDLCLVKNGAPIATGEMVSFQYANSFRYPLSVTSDHCC